MTEALFQALANLATIDHIAHLALGVGLGLAVGAFPGLGGIVGLSMVMPFLYGMDTISALATLIGIVAVIPTSDTFTSILMGIPGSSASQATVLDGFPLSQQGQASRALAAAFTASLLGGLVGALILSLFVQIARPLDSDVRLGGVVHARAVRPVDGRRVVGAQPRQGSDGLCDGPRRRLDRRARLRPASSG